MREPCRGEQAGGPELVVHGEQRAGAVADVVAGALEQEELEQPRLRTVQVAGDVHPADRHVTDPEPRGRVRRPHDLGGQAEGAPAGGEHGVGEVRVPAQDRDRHPVLRLLPSEDRMRPRGRLR